MCVRFLIVLFSKALFLRSRIYLLSLEVLDHPIENGKAVHFCRTLLFRIYLFVFFRKFRSVSENRNKIEIEESFSFLESRRESMRTREK